MSIKTKRQLRKRDAECGSKIVWDDQPASLRHTARSPASSSMPTSAETEKSKRGYLTVPSPTIKGRRMTVTKRKKAASATKPPKPPYPPLRPKAPIKFQESVTMPDGKKLEIGGVRDEVANRYVILRKETLTVSMPLTAWHGSSSDASAAMRAQGLIVVGGMAEIREKVSQLAHFRRMPIVTKPGWSQHGFVLPDGRVLTAADQPYPLMAFTPEREQLGESGTLQGWMERVAAPLAEHLFASFVIMVAFAASLLRFINRADNFGFELSGEPGRGKSTLLFLAASAAGRAIGDGETTYWRSLNTTMNALETVMAAHADMPLILDEAGLMQGAGKAETRGQQMREVAFRLAAGQVKHRFGESASPRSRLVYLLSTNRPVASLMENAFAAENAAIADRLITLPLTNDRAHGIFDHCPPSYASTSAFVDDLKQAASEHYGHALPAFLKYLVGEVARRPKRLQRRVDQYIAHFVEHCGVNANDGSQVRVAEAFALVYAAGRLAKAAAVLPESYRCLAAARAGFDLHRVHGRTAVSFDDRLVTLMRHRETIDLAMTDIGSLTEEQRRNCPVFLYTGRSGQRELLVPIRHVDRVFPGWRALSKNLDVQHRLQKSSDRPTRDRPVGAKGVQEPVYCFNINDLSA